tara:strand:+ start:230473 stop:231984 length:1512 start_codon:yes stop_codon:yes gene_type:complete
MDHKHIIKDKIVKTPKSSKYKSALGLVTLAQIKQVERHAKDQGMSELELIERAGIGIAEFIIENFERSPIVFLCGGGANGSDGFVAASRLERLGWDVTLYCTKQKVMLSGVVGEAAQHWKGDVATLSEIILNDGDIVVDAVLGNGMNKPLTSEINETFNAVRQKDVTVIAVDVPTGLNCKNLTVDPCILKADYTVTTTRTRIEHVLQPGAQYCGKIHVADIGISLGAFTGMNITAHINAPELWQHFWSVPDSYTHKYKRGHVGVLGGVELTGAARLAVSAAMRAGAGLGSIATTKEAAKLYQSIVAPEVMVRGFDSEQEATALMQQRSVSVCLIGPGADREGGLDMQRLAELCKAEDMQIVLDGDALGTVPLKLATIITPHEGEFLRLFPHLADIHNKLEKTKRAAAEANCIVVLKGMDTIIASPDGRAYINNKASPWLSTAGSGDVLAGAVAGCLAQKIPPFEAACSAVWMHGYASLTLGPGMVASELPKALASGLSVIYDL